MSIRMVHEGFRDGENDGPYKDEEHTSEIDGDIVWIYDLMGELDAFPFGRPGSDRTAPPRPMDRALLPRR